jgi:hypothetical protein
VSFANRSTLIFHIPQFFAKLVSFTKKGSLPRTTRKPIRSRSKPAPSAASADERTWNATPRRPGGRQRGARQADGAEPADPTNQPTPRLGGSYGDDGGFWRRFFKLSRMSWRTGALNPRQEQWVGSARLRPHHLRSLSSKELLSSAPAASFAQSAASRSHASRSTGLIAFSAFRRHSSASRRYLFAAVSDFMAGSSKCSGDGSVRSAQ